MPLKDRETVVLFSTTPVWNIPPLINVAKALSCRGYRVLVVGYHADGLPKYERISRNAYILRVSLKSRRAKLALWRKIFSLAELLSAVRNVARRVQPAVFVAFSDPATLALNRHVPARLKVAWMLEYPELEFASRGERIALKLGVRRWRAADALVAPTLERLALHLSRSPESIHLPSFVIHNAPSRTAPSKGGGLAADAPVNSAIETLREFRRRGLASVIYAGAIGKRYAIPELIEAVRTTPSAALLIVGKKHDLSLAELDEALSLCRGSERVVWVDEIPYSRLQEVLVEADVGFSHYPGDSLNTRFSAPGKIYEYLRAGLYVLTDTETCLRQSLEVSGCGAFFARPGSVANISEALQALVARLPQARERQERAQTLFDSSLCIEQQIQPFLTYLQDTLKGKDRQI